MSLKNIELQKKKKRLIYQIDKKKQRFKPSNSVFEDNSLILKVKSHEPLTSYRFVSSAVLQSSILSVRSR